MGYKLYKKLEKAGFPFKEKILFQNTGTLDGNKHTVTVSEYFPTLEELIEACPKTITGPNNNTKEKGEVEHLFRLGFSGYEWFAHYEFYNSYILHEHGYVLDGWGKTPSEAVANIWLSLHTK